MHDTARLPIQWDNILITIQKSPTISARIDILQVKRKPKSEHSTSAFDRPEIIFSPIY